MPQIILRYDDNKDLQFLHLMQWFVGNKLMTLEESLLLYKRFTSREDLTIDIPSELASDFRVVLDGLKTARPTL